jgi:hypothetical protein
MSAAAAKPEHEEEMITMQSERAELIDPIGMTDVFCTNLAKIEPIGSGSCVRLVFAVPQGMLGDGQIENFVVAKLVVPVEEMAAMAETLLTRRAASVPRPDRVTLNS